MFLFSITKYKKHPILRGVFWILSRAMIFYCILFWLTGRIVSHERIEFGLKIRILDNMMPDTFQPLILYEDGRTAVNENIVKKYIQFYLKLVRFFPERADGYSMLAFCYNLIGGQQQAVWAYQKALAIVPDDFWFNYNLGLLYFKHGYYPKATEYFQQAVSADPQKTLQYIRDSKVIYFSVLRHFDNWNLEIERRLQAGYHNAYILLNFCQYMSKNYNALLQTTQKGLVSSRYGAQNELHFFAGLAAYHLKDYGKAAEQLKACIQLKPDFLDAYYYLILALKESGRTEEAQDYFRKLSKIPGNVFQSMANVSAVQPRVNVNQLRLQMF